MTTPLHSTLRRALNIAGREYVVTLTDKAIKLTLKGKRNGFELPWTKIVNGEAALAVALHASIGAFAAERTKSIGPGRPADKRPAGKRSPRPAGSQRRTSSRRA